jgi:hypothetical protein
MASCYETLGLMPISSCAYVVLKELGVHGTFTNFDEFCMELIPFDCDLLSMEMELSFRVTVSLPFVVDLP